MGRVHRLAAELTDSGSCQLLSKSALADPDAEREARARLIHEIEALEPIIATAESQANPDARIRFRDDWLRQDLERIRAGSRNTSTRPVTNPRTR